MDKEALRTKLLMASFRAIKSVSVMKSGSHILIDIRAFPDFVSSAFSGMRVRLRIMSPTGEETFAEGALARATVTTTNGYSAAHRLYAMPERIPLRIHARPPIVSSHRSHAAMAHHFRFVPDATEDAAPISTRKVFERSGITSKSNVAEVTFLSDGTSQTHPNVSFSPS